MHFLTWSIQMTVSQPTGLCERVILSLSEEACEQWNLKSSKPTPPSFV